MVSNNKDKGPWREEMDERINKEKEKIASAKGESTRSKPILVGSVNTGRSFSHNLQGALPPALDLDSFPCVEEAIRVADEFCDQYRALRREVEILQEENQRLRRMLEYYSNPSTRPSPPHSGNNESLQVLVQNCKIEKLKLKEILMKREKNPSPSSRRSNSSSNWIPILEKAPSKRNIWKIKRRKGISRKFLLGCGGRQEGERRNHFVERTLGAARPRAGASCGLGAPQPLSPPFLRVLLRPENLSHRGYLTKSYSRLCGAENTREKRALRRAGIRRGNSLPEGEIDAIAIVIELDIISIIIIIISTIYTAITTAAPRHRCNNLGWILIV
ncbi:hypothetical protein QYE76_004013 [Lolium multiflorum]|uniref:Uncharacterized protein n=1 Tax=Lolium multiflorum TaxID=4521 RepID=A0AAD8RPV6_LOLMU|nr:hypothetical protein QYE76_004013 [Lolium multiflorum]